MSIIDILANLGDLSIDWENKIKKLLFLPIHMRRGEIGHGFKAEISGRNGIRRRCCAAALFVHTAVNPAGFEAQALRRHMVMEQRLCDMQNLIRRDTKLAFQMLQHIMEIVRVGLV